MATFYSPRMITEGLKFCVDAANVRSYPGSGTTWYDISGNGNTATGAGTPTYDSANNGSFNLSGGIKYFDIPNLGLISDITLEAVVNLNSRNGPHQTAICTHPSYRAGIKLMASYHGSLAVWAGNAAGTLDYMASSSGIENAGICYIAATRKATDGTIILYLNGSQVATTTGSTGDITSSTGQIGLEYHSGSYGFNGKIYVAKAYNQVLTATEISQNFNSLRTRFGI